MGPVKQLLDARLDDEKTDRVARSISEAVKELQALPAVATQIINDVELPDSVIKLVPHRLGRRPRITLISPPRGPVAIGIIEERTAENPDRTKYLALKASGMGAAVIVDIEVK